MLTAEKVAFFHEHGYLHIPGVFSRERMEALSEDMDWLIDQWSEKSPGWSGPWRRKYMDEATERASKLVAMHDLWYYSAPWMRCITDEKLTGAMSDLLGPAVEVHHSTMHVKPPETGHPFPLHQDWAFYKHRDGRYVDVLVPLDDPCHDNGEIRFLDGSHQGGALEHITETEEGACTPHLPTDQYRLADTVAVPAKVGDVVCFNIHMIHGSHINRTDRARRLVRIGYRHPENEQFEGQSVGRPCVMVCGRRKRSEGQPLYSNDGPANTANHELGSGQESSSPVAGAT